MFSDLLPPKATQHCLSKISCLHRLSTFRYSCPTAASSLPLSHLTPCHDIFLYYYILSILPSLPMHMICFCTIIIVHFVPTIALHSRRHSVLGLVTFFLYFSLLTWTFMFPIQTWSSCDSRTSRFDIPCYFKNPNLYPVWSSLFGMTKSVTFPLSKDSPHSHSP